MQLSGLTKRHPHMVVKMFESAMVAWECQIVETCIRIIQACKLEVVEALGNCWVDNLAKQTRGSRSSY